MGRDAAWLRDMLRFATLVSECVRGISEADFLTDFKTQGATLHYVTLLGEAARRVSQTYRDAHQEIDWPGIVGFRNRIVHEYDQYNLDAVWHIVLHDVPKLTAALQPLVGQPTNGKDEHS